MDPQVQIKDEKTRFVYEAFEVDLTAFSESDGIPFEGTPADFESTPEKFMTPALEFILGKKDEYSSAERIVVADVLISGVQEHCMPVPLTFMEGEADGRREFATKIKDKLLNEILPGVQDETAEGTRFNRAQALAACWNKAENHNEFYQLVAAFTHYVKFMSNPMMALMAGMKDMGGTFAELFAEEGE